MIRFAILYFVLLLVFISMIAGLVAYVNMVKNILFLDSLLLQDQFRLV